MTDTISSKQDVIDSILGIEPGSEISQIRDQFEQNRIDFQAYYDALFLPIESSVQELSLEHRYLIAIRVASHTGSTAVADWYTAEARSAGASESLIELASTPGVSDTGDNVLDATLRHADLLVTHPVDASRQDLEALEAAGLGPGSIVSLSQVVAFVSYQLRFVALIKTVGELS